MNALGTGRLSITLHYKDGTKKVIDPIRVLHHRTDDGIIHSEGLEIGQTGSGRTMQESIIDLISTTKWFFDQMRLHGDDLEIVSSPEKYITKLEEIETEMRAERREKLMKILKTPPVLQWQKSIMDGKTIQKAETEYALSA